MKFREGFAWGLASVFGGALLAIATRPEKPSGPLKTHTLEGRIISVTRTPAEPKSLDSAGAQQPSDTEK